MWHRLALRPAIPLALMIVFVAGATQADGPTDHSALDKQLSDALRDMHNRAADLFNVQKDYHGAYRMFQGGLYMTRPLLAYRPELQQMIDSGMQDSEKLASVPERAMRLHKTIEDVRAKLKPAAAAKPPEVKVPESKPPESKAPMNPAPAAPKPLESPFPPPGAATTLWKKLGSDDGVKKVVDTFVTLVITDPKIDFTRGGKFPITTKEQEDAIKSKLVAYISSVSDGTIVYTGKSMADVHKGMAITAEQFDALAASLKIALSTNKVADADIEELMKKVNATKADIVGK